MNTGSAPIRRTEGQLPILPGATIAHGFVFTSGIIAPAARDAMTTGASVAFETQVAGAMESLLHVLEEAGSSPACVLRIEAFVASSQDVPAWNEAFLAIWPAPGPARTTLIGAFTSPAIRFELQATAVVA